MRWRSLLLVGTAVAVAAVLAWTATMWPATTTATTTAATPTSWTREPAAGQPVPCATLPTTLAALQGLGVMHSVVRRSVAHAGSAARLRRFVDRAARGLPVKVAVLGGSISVGVGLYNETSARYYDLLFQWLESSLSNRRRSTPPKAASFSPSSSSSSPSSGAAASPPSAAPSQWTRSISVLNAVGSGYWRYCFPQHLDRDVDLVLVDVALNDAPYHLDALLEHVVNEEKLLRALLALPQQPAVVLVAFLANEYVTAQETLHALAVNYDLPLISLRDTLQAWTAAGHMTPASFRTIFYNSDNGHPNESGHRLVGNLLIHFFQQHVFDCDKSAAFLALEHATLGAAALTDSSVELLPAAVAFVARPVAAAADGAPPPSPLCLTTYTVPPLAVAVAPSATPAAAASPDSAVPAGVDGWAWYTSENGRKRYWRTTEVGKPAGFAFYVPADGTVVHMSSLKASYLAGSLAACWVTDVHNTTLVVPAINVTTVMPSAGGPANPELNFGMNTLLGKLRGPSHYLLWCMMTFGTDFRVIGVLGD